MSRAGAALDARTRSSAWFAATRLDAVRLPARGVGARRRRRSGLIHATTGAGKTYAAVAGAALQAAARARRARAGPLRVLWITPLRALAADTARRAARPLARARRNWTVGTAPATRRRATRAPVAAPADALVTTPESLSLLLTSRGRARALRRLAMRRRRRMARAARHASAACSRARARAPAALNPRPARVWGLSATLGNLAEALRALLGAVRRGALVAGACRAHGRRRAACPRASSAFRGPGTSACSCCRRWSMRSMRRAASTLLFTNTRSQAETLVPGAARRGPMAGHARPAPRLARPRDARRGRGGAARRHAARRGLHLQPRPRRGFLAASSR